MTTRQLPLLISVAALVGCASVPPTELVDARESHRRASTGPAAKVAPEDVHVASTALAAAEASFDDKGDTWRTRDLAYVAERKAQLAEAIASTRAEQKTRTTAEARFETTQGELVDRTQDDLADTRQALSDSEQSGALTASALSEERTARERADERAAEALAKLAEVRRDDRGTVITLSGSVLFSSNRATLLSNARSRLEQVTDVLLEQPDRDLTIEGHTDSQGSDLHNDELSRRRADAVRSALVARGYPPERIRVSGLGESQPVADNATAEGRANNRRVEIIVADQ